ncbi:hypothetical protein BDR07DRAFT_1398735 [Suillus spraguei]|nr:hypothetical protein BDR07DRAFT_1398735 [Suillus spraguei]
MVYKIGGYIFTIDLVRVWLQKMGVKHEDIENTGICTALRHWFDERGITNVMPVPTAYPPGSRKHVVVMARTEREDPYSTPSRYSIFPEEPSDREWKEQVMKESGLTDEQIPWGTVADPWFQESRY